MTAYELMIKTNHHLIKGGELTDAQKANIVRQLLAAQNTRNEVQRFYRGMRCPNNIDQMYPIFYIPPYNNGQKLQTVISMSPKTHILAANSYELEILRILYMFSPDDPKIHEMVVRTLERLKKTCFGYKSCAVGECFETGIVVLRFLSSVASTEINWIKKQIAIFNSHYIDKNRHSGVLKYYWLCLSEVPFDLAELEILHYKDHVQSLVEQKSKSNDSSDYHLVLMCVMHNVLIRLSEYSLKRIKTSYTTPMKKLLL